MTIFPPFLNQKEIKHYLLLNGLLVDHCEYFFPDQHHMMQVVHVHFHSVHKFVKKEGFHQVFELSRNSFRSDQLHPFLPLFEFDDVLIERQFGFQRLISELTVDPSLFVWILPLLGEYEIFSCQNLLQLDEPLGPVHQRVP